MAHPPAHAHPAPGSARPRAAGRRGPPGRRLPRTADLLDPEVRSVTVQRGSVDAVARHLPLAGGQRVGVDVHHHAPAGGARPSPDCSSSTTGHQPEIAALLARANPGTDARPFERPGQHWVGVRDDRRPAGRLRRPRAQPRRPPDPVRGSPSTPPQRGRGLGLAVTAYLTRRAVEDDGVCTLGMYSHNAVARRVYLGLGYGDVHEWSSRRFALTWTRLHPVQLT